MQNALRDADARDEAQKINIAALQGTAVLQGVYVGRVQEKLQSYEEKASKGKGKGKLMGDGMPKLLTGEDFHGKVVEHTTRQDQEKAEKERRKAEKKRYRQEVEAWEGTAQMVP